MNPKTLVVHLPVDEKASSEKNSFAIRAQIRAFKICLACLPGNFISMLIQ
jgi:hypothetical protein